MAYQLTGTYGTGIGPTYTFVVKKLLETAKPLMPLAGLAQTKTIPLHSGKTAKFTRLMQLAKVTTAATENAAATPVAPTAQEFEVTTAIWENAIGLSTFLDDTFINPALAAYSEILGINAGESMELELQKTLGAVSTTDDIAGMMAFVADDSQYGTNNVTGTATSAGTTTKLIDTALTQAADFWKGGWITFTNPAEQNYGLSRKCLAFDASADSLYWTTAVKVATSSTAPKTTYRLASPGATSSLTAGTDVLNAKVLRRVKTLLHKHMAMPLSGGFYVGTVDPDNEEHLTGDTATGGFIETHKYTDNTIILDGELGRLAGVRLVAETNPYELSSSSSYDYSDGGALVMNFVVGRDCLGRCGLSGQADTQVLIKRSGPQTTSDPTDKLCTMAWKTTFARLRLNSCWGVGVLTSPTRI